MRWLANGARKLISSMRYEPYGNLRHTASVAGFATQPLGYTGTPFDPEGAVIYLNARYYAPGEARFIQRDSIFGSDSDPVSLNRYASARNNPTVFTDPTGHWFLPVAGQWNVGGNEYEMWSGPGGGMGFMGGGGGMPGIGPGLAAAAAAAAQRLGSIVLPVLDRAGQLASGRGHTVYQWINTATNQVYYVGRTSDFQRRLGEWQRSPIFQDLTATERIVMRPVPGLQDNLTLLRLVW